jgi:hypothetical protein
VELYKDDEEDEVGILREAIDGNKYHIGAIRGG